MHARVAMYEHDHNAPHHTMITSIITDLPAPFVLAVALAGVFLIAFMKGAFGGGFAIVGIPLLSLAMDPIAAGALLAPLFVIMDITALRFWRPNTWSRVDLAMLLPALVVGIGLGYFVLRDLDRHAVEIVMGVVTLVFAALWFIGGGVRARPSRPRSPACLPVSRRWWRIRAGRRLRSICCRSACRRRSTPAPPACSSRSATS
jgi:uncharacterized membrane protein YfcA